MTFGHFCVCGSVTGTSSVHVSNQTSRTETADSALVDSIGSTDGDIKLTSDQNLISNVKVAHKLLILNHIKFYY